MSKLAKADQPPPVPTDLQGILTTLSTSTNDKDRIAQALNNLFVLDTTSLPTNDAESCSLFRQVAACLHQSEGHATVQTCTLKVIAKLQNSTVEAVAKQSCSSVVLQACWAVLDDFLHAWDEYQSAVSAIMASGGFSRHDPNSKQAKAAKAGTAALDPESTLPGPTKIALDAVLRILSTSQIRSESQHILPSIILENGSSGALPIMKLMQYHSPRVQYRAVQLITLLTQHQGARLKMIEQDIVPVLLGVMSDSNTACVRLAAIQALKALVKYAPTAALIQLHDDPEALSLIMKHITGCPPPPPPLERQGSFTSVASSVVKDNAKKAGKDQIEAAPSVDYTRPFPCEQVDIQLATVQLLSLITHHSQVTTEQLVKQGGVQQFLSLLPAGTPSSLLPAGTSTQPSPVAGAVATAAAVGAEVPPALPVIPVDDKLTESVMSMLGGVESQLQVASSSEEIDAWLPYCNTAMSSAAASQQGTAPQSPPPPAANQLTQLCSTEAVVHGLRIMYNMLSVEGVQNALFETLLRDLRARQVVPGADSTEQAADEGAADASVAGDAGAVVADNQPVEPAVIQPALACQVLSALLCMFKGEGAVRPPSPAPPQTARADRDKSAAAKRQTADVGLALAAPPPTLTPPFSGHVRGAALEGLAVLARVPIWARLISALPQVQDLVRRCGAAEPPPPPPPPQVVLAAPVPIGKGAAGKQQAAAAAAAQAAAAAAAAQAPPVPSLIIDTASSGGSQDSNKEPDIEKDVMHGLAILLQALSEYQYPNPNPAHDLEVPDSKGDGASMGDQKAIDLLFVTKILAKQALAKCSDAQGDLHAPTGGEDDFMIRTAVAGATLALPQKLLMVEARPPLPSPPPTPPPQPLATSIFLWDALNRPVMVDGDVRLGYM